MSSPISVALAGIAGYGDLYLEAILRAHTEGSVRLVGVADPAAARSRRFDQLTQLGIRIVEDVPDLYRDSAPDLAILATPIHLHSRQTCFCLERQSHVLCEKPMASTIRDARRMVSAAALHRRNVSFGYQWSYTHPVQSLKQDIMAGNLGQPRHLKSLILFPRGVDYFARNNWVGRKTTATGEPVFDGPANNAAAHYLHNMFYVLGATRETSAAPKTTQAELYRANDIENYDTAAIRCKTEAGVEILFYASHAANAPIGPILRFEFDDAVVTYENESGAGFVARWRNGRVKHYGEPALERTEKIRQTLDAIRSGAEVACGVRAAMSQVIAVAAAQQSMPNIGTFPPALVHTDQLNGRPIVCVSGLAGAMVQCYDQALLPSEHGGFEWARSGQVIGGEPDASDIEPVHDVAMASA